LAHSLAATGELDEALVMAEDALVVAGDNRWCTAEGLIARGVVRRYRGEPGEADLVEARRIAKLHGFPHFLAEVDRLLAGHDIRQP
jgi:hypothetical protein